MDWKEAGKWIAVITIGGVLSTIFEIVMTCYVTATAASVAHEETERTILATAKITGANAASTSNRCTTTNQPNLIIQ